MEPTFLVLLMAGSAHKLESPEKASRSTSWPTIDQKRRTLPMEILLQQIINGLVLGSMYAWSRWATPWCTASSTSSILRTVRC